MNVIVAFRRLFLSCSAVLWRGIGIGDISLHPSHAGIESKLMIIGSRALHHR